MSTPSSTDIPITVLTEDVVYSNSLSPVTAIAVPPSAGTSNYEQKILNTPENTFHPGGAPAHSTDHIIWDFGDGTTYTGVSAIHTYEWPGEYQVNVTVIDRFGQPVVSENGPYMVTVVDYIPTQTEFSIQRNVYDIPAGQTNNPIQIDFMLSWQHYELYPRPAPLCEDGHQHHMNTGKSPPQWMCGMNHTELEILEEPVYTFNVYTSGAESQPLDINRFQNKKYEHLKLDWTIFSATPSLSTTPATAIDVTLLDSLTGNSGDPNTYELIYLRRDEDDTLVRASSTEPGAVFVGLSGNATFYYRDDIAKNPTSRELPVNIFAQLDGLKLQDKEVKSKYSKPEASYNNIKTLRLNNVKTRVNRPAGLSITSNGLNVLDTTETNIFRINENKWQNSEIVFTTTIQDFGGFNILNTTTFNRSPDGESTIGDNFEVKLISGGTDLIPSSAYTIYDAATSSTSTMGSYQGVLSSAVAVESVQLSGRVEYDQVSGYTTDATEAYFNTKTSSTTGMVYKYTCRDVAEWDSDVLTGNITNTVEGIGVFLNPNGIISDATVINPGSTLTRPPGIVITDPTGTGARLIPIHDVSAQTVTDVQVVSGGINYTSTPTIDYILNPGATPPVVNLDITVNYNIDKFAVSLADLNQNVSVWGIETGATPRLLQITSTGTVTTSLPLTSYVETPGTPVDIMLNSEKNPWVVCDSKIFQVDSTTNTFIQSITSANTIIGADVDIDDNLYTVHTASGDLTKYSSTGDLLDTIEVSSTLNIIDILCCYSKMYVLLDDGTLVTYNSDDVVTTSTSKTTTTLPGSSWSNLTTGTDQNVYVVYDNNNLYCHDTSTVITTFSGGMINHISGDSRGLIWLVDSGNELIHLVDILNSSPLTDNGMYDSIQYNKISHTAFPVEFTDLQTSGDWLGFKWLQKYGYIPEQTLTLTGTSNTFNIHPVCGKYGINKFGEDHNHGQTLKSYAQQPWLNDNFNLWDNFIYTALGTDESDPNSIGKLYYEKISNFTSNNCDLDECNIDSIHSYATIYKADIQKFNFDYPPSMKRLIDICSIKHKRLFGEVDKLTDTYDMFSEYQTPETRENLGEQIDFNTYMLKPGTKIIAYEKFSKTFQPITITYPTTGNVDSDGNIIDKGIDTDLVGMSETASYPLSAYSPFWHWNLIAPITVGGQYINKEITYYYDFWTYNQSPSAEQVEGVINWSDPQTTLETTTSAYSAWADDTEIVDNILEHQLRKGLNMLSIDNNHCY